VGRLAVAKRQACAGTCAGSPATGPPPHRNRFEDFHASHQQIIGSAGVTSDAIIETMGAFVMNELSNLLPRTVMNVLHWIPPVIFVYSEVLVKRVV
jgi:hypothetical protein